MTDVRRSSSPATNGAKLPDHDGPAASECRSHPGDEHDPLDGWTGPEPYGLGPAAWDAWDNAWDASRGTDGRAPDLHAGAPLTRPAALVARLEPLVGKVELVRPTLPDLLHVTRNMRERDRMEIFATRWDDDPDAIAHETMELAGFMWVVKKGDTPVSVFGARPLWPGVWCATAFGTDHWPEVVLSMTRHILKFMIPGLTPRAHLVVAFCHEDHHSSIRWLRSMGAEPIAPVLFEWGRERENFILVGWRA